VLYHFSLEEALTSGGERGFRRPSIRVKTEKKGISIWKRGLEESEKRKWGDRAAFYSRVFREGLIFSLSEYYLIIPNGHENRTKCSSFSLNHYPIWEKSAGGKRFEGEFCTRSGGAAVRLTLKQGSTSTHARGESKNCLLKSFPF